MTRRPRRPGPRLVVALVVSIAAVAVLFVGIFPTRAFLAQRSEILRAEAQLADTEATNEQLEQRVAALGTDAEIERLAREQYNLVLPGEEAYALLPAPTPPIPVPDAWPFRSLRAAVGANPAEGSGGP